MSNRFTIHRFEGEGFTRTGPLDPTIVVAPPPPPDPAFARLAAACEQVRLALDFVGLMDSTEDEREYIARTILVVADAHPLTPAPTTPPTPPTT